MFNGIIHSKVLSKMATIELGRKKDIVAVTDEREVAEAVADGIRDAIVDNGHVQSGRLFNSISVVKSGDEFEVKAVDYAKYVNGRVVENGGPGFINEGIQQAQREYPREFIQPIIQTPA